MKAMSTLAMFLALLAAPAGSVKLTTAMSPITRVAELLEGLAKQIAEQTKKEEDLYETYVCWAKTVIDTKTATNAAAEARIEELETYISDLDAGRIELTSERADLEKEIAELNADLEDLKATREQEHADFLEAETEMKQAIAALEKAIEVLKEATAAHEKGVLAQTHVQETETFKAYTAEASLLVQAVDLGEKFLSKGDALFLRKILTGDVPKRADWKTLNRKATFKMSYKARSFKIQEVLAKMLTTFQTNLKDAQEKEAASQATYDKLHGTKTGQKEEAEAAFEEMAEENGARGLSRAEAEDEVAALKDQVKADEGYIKQVTDELATKKEEWKTRKALMAGEIEAISKTLAILRSDDARDLFKKSLESQGYFFMQEGLTSQASQQRTSAAEVLRLAAQKAGDVRLAKLAKTISSFGSGGSHFDEVIKAIDDMIALLKQEEEEDLKNKQTCELDRMKDTRTAAVTSRKIDDLSDKITRLLAEIKDLEEQIAANKETIAKTKEELKEATQIRKDEHTEWQANDKDDTAAAELIMQAKGVLEEFYTSNNLMLVQKQEPYTVPEIQAGKAPPPPPTTWDAPYGGKVEESQGILAILEMIHEDILKDKAAAKEEEDKAEAAYQEMKKESLALIAKLQAANTEMEGTIATKKEDIKSAKEDQTTLKKQLDAVMKKMEDLKPGCDFILINYEMRRKNYQIEIDGLYKAKAILEGASFGEAPDPNREYKPGDAFLQRRH